MDNAYFNHQTTVAYHQVRFGLAYTQFHYFQGWLASTNAANVITTNFNEKHTVSQTEKNPTTSGSSDNAQTTKSSRMEWNYGHASALVHFWSSNIDNTESLISNNI